MLYQIANDALVPWFGAVIDDIIYPLNIAQLWSDEDLAAIGLYRPRDPDPVPEGKQEVGRSVQLVDGVPKVVLDLEDLPAPPPPPPDFSSDPIGHPLADWQLRMGLVANGYSIETIEATIKAIEDPAEREMFWNAWDRPTVIRWDSPATQTFMTWLGIPESYARDMWMTAKDYALSTVAPVPVVADAP